MGGSNNILSDGSCKYLAPFSGYTAWVKNFDAKSDVTSEPKDGTTGPPSDTTLEPECTAQTQAILTFVATGCLNSNPESGTVNWWVNQNSPFEDMMTYCTRTRDGVASQPQKDLCCGPGVDCGAELTCVRQTSLAPCQTGESTIPTQSAFNVSNSTLAPSVAPTTTKIVGKVLIHCKVGNIVPTNNPTVGPTVDPTANPTFSSPSVAPSQGPSEQPTVAPTVDPTTNPTSSSPSVAPSQGPSEQPTVAPTVDPTANPTVQPTTSPSITPTTSFP